MRSIKLLFSLILIFLLVGCFYSKESSIDPSHIKIDDDIYLKPLGKNEKGCSIFSPYSISDQGIVQVIYFLDQDGNPTTISNPKGCL